MFETRESLTSLASSWFCQPAIWFPTSVKEVNCSAGWLAAADQRPLNRTQQHATAAARRLLHTIAVKKVPPNRCSPLVQPLVWTGRSVVAFARGNKSRNYLPMSPRAFDTRSFFSSSCSSFAVDNRHHLEASPFSSPFAAARQQPEHRCCLVLAQECT